MNPTQTPDLLEQQLQSLQDDVPPMPEDFHAGWMKQVEEEAMQKPAKKISWSRILSVAAAAVFVIGGTLMTRDQLSAPQYASGSSYDYAVTYTSSEAGGAYSMRSASYDSAAYEESAPAENGMVMMAKAAGDAASGVDMPQKIIRTASLTISTQHFEESLASLRTLCEEKGGWISYSSESDSGSRRTAYLSLRVPSDQLDAFLQGTDGAGRITQRDESATDVTESYYDTKARLETQQALMARLQALVTEAADLSDLLALESQIADTQYQIDRLQSSLNSTDRQVDYATVDISLREELPSDSITDVEMTLGQRLADAFSTGLEAFAEFISDMVVFLVAALPFLLVVAVAVIAVKLLRRRKK